MTKLRVRLAALVVLVGLGAFFVFELPIRELFQQRNAIAATSSQLSAVQSANRQLSSTISSLQQMSVVSAIAHEEYGLVLPHQRSYVVLPSSQQVAGAADTLSNQSIPQSDLITNDIGSSGASPSSSSSSPAHSGGSSLFERTFSRLAFWRWAF